MSQVVSVSLVELGVAAAPKCDADGSVLVLQSQLAIEWSKKLQQAAELYPRGSWLGTHDTPSFDWTALPLTWSVLLLCVLPVEDSILTPPAGCLPFALPSWAPDLPPGLPLLPFKLSKAAMHMPLSQHHSTVPFLLECFTTPHQWMCLMWRTH